jgi:hypothetical protein
MAYFQVVNASRSNARRSNVRRSNDGGRRVLAALWANYREADKPLRLMVAIHLTLAAATLVALAIALGASTLG